MILSTFDQDVLAVGGSYLNSLLDESIVYHLDASGFSGEVDRIIIGEVAEFAFTPERGAYILDSKEMKFSKLQRNFYSIQENSGAISNELMALSDRSIIGISLGRLRIWKIDQQVWNEILDSNSLRSKRTPDELMSLIIDPDWFVDEEVSYGALRKTG